jgi:protein phosphatase
VESGSSGSLFLSEASLQRRWRTLVGDHAGRRSIETASMSRQGLARAQNDDQFLVADLERSLLVRDCGFDPFDDARLTDATQGHVLMVADGVGGTRGGSVASEITVDTMAVYAFALMPWVLSAMQIEPEYLERGLEAAVRHAQRRMRDVADQRGIDPRLATTLTMAYIAWPHMHLVHVGDSRAYLSRGDDLRRLSNDHTLAQALIERGLADVNRKDIESRWGHVLANAVGGSSDELYVELRGVQLQPGDRVLLCTDGLTAYLDDEELAERLADPRPVENLVAEMVDVAFERGGHDDVTVILARM